MPVRKVSFSQGFMLCVISIDRLHISSSHRYSSAVVSRVSRSYPSCNSAARFQTKQGLPYSNFRLYKQKDVQKLQVSKFYCMRKDRLLESIDSRRDITENKDNDSKTVLKKNSIYFSFSNFAQNIRILKHSTVVSTAGQLYHIC